MEAFSLDTDDAILAEMGNRLARARLSRDRTQAELAHAAGVSKRTVERLEAGHSTQLTSLIRVLRALDLLERLDDLLPPARPEPMDLLRREGQAPKRARGSARDGPSGEDASEDGKQTGSWTWGEDP